MTTEEKRESGSLRDQRNSDQKKRSQIAWFLLLVAASVAADQWTKRLALNAFRAYEHIPLIPGVLEFCRIENRGAAFGILQGHMVFFYGITAVVCLLILTVTIKTPAEKKYNGFLLALAMIVSGAIGNLIDRVVRQSVVDFIYFVPIDFPVFNVADIFVTCGTGLLMILILWFYRDGDFAFLSSSTVCPTASDTHGSTRNQKEQENRTEKKKLK